MIQKDGVNQFPIRKMVLFLFCFLSSILCVIIQIVVISDNNHLNEVIEFYSGDVFYAALTNLIGCIFSFICVNMIFVSLEDNIEYFDLIKSTINVKSSQDFAYFALTSGLIGLVFVFLSGYVFYINLMLMFIMSFFLLRFLVSFNFPFKNLFHLKKRFRILSWGKLIIFIGSYHFISALSLLPSLLEFNFTIKLIIIIIIAILFPGTFFYYVNDKAVKLEEEIVTRYYSGMAINKIFCPSCGISVQPEIIHALKYTDFAYCSSCHEKISKNLTKVQSEDFVLNEHQKMMNKLQKKQKS
ncbi:hypothetical protein [Candidatus Lokiarchaeum ossiferum]|uniref:hypothetical protein n=1 Tax=Candidatus Lokiarchaeum ossiferum TaxID=2951803 RepID=UPI00352CD86C